LSKFSKLSRTRVRIALSPGFAATAWIEGMVRPQVVKKQLLDCTLQPDSEDTGPWQGAAAMLATVGAELKNTPCDVTLVLSNHFVRYTLVPENKSISGTEEELAFARYCFNKIHGERSKGWEVRLTGSSSDPARVASAVDSGLLQAIRGCFPAGGKARLVSVQPYLMSAFNLCREIAGKYATWLLLIEPERACLACFEGGRWVAVRNMKGDYQGPTQWASLLSRERYLAGVAEPRTNVLVHAGPAGRDKSIRVGKWKFRSLSNPVIPGISPAEDARLAMALCSR
jgi:hypothetical protein